MPLRKVAQAMAGKDLQTGDAAAPQSIDIGATITDVLDLLPMGVQIDDLEHRTIYVNDKFTQMLGYTLADIADLEGWFLRAYPDPVERDLMRRDWQAMLAHAEATQTEIPVIERTLTCKTGEKKVIEFHIRRVGSYYIYLNTDISARYHMEAELRRLAYTDPLTKIANRRHFFEMAERLIAMHDQPVAALMFDLDHFKALNDGYGHRIGDEVLVEVTTRCRAILDEEWQLGRLGGEEFGVLLPGCGKAEAVAVAERLRRAVADSPVQFPSCNVKVSISIGGTCVAPGETQIDLLMSRADRALYAAKRAGRNKVRFSDP